MGRRASFSNARSELAVENNTDSDLNYSRTGGCFVTTKKVIVLVILALVALTAVGSFIFFYKENVNSTKEEASFDLEKSINISINNADKQIRLPTDLDPLHYRLRIHPYLDEHNEKNFTFSGRVTISIVVRKSTNQIVLNSEFLDIDESDIKLLATTSLSLRSLSQTVENIQNAEQGQVLSVNKRQVPSESDRDDSFVTFEPQGTLEPVQPVELNGNTENTGNTNANNEGEMTNNVSSQPVTTKESLEPNLGKLLPNMTHDKQIISNEDAATFITLSQPGDSSTLTSERTSNQNVKSNEESGSFVATAALNQSLLPNLEQPTIPTEFPPLLTELPEDLTSSLPTITTDNSVIYSIGTNSNLQPTKQKVTQIPIKSREMDVKNGLLTIKLGQKLKLDVTYTLDIKFSGKIQNNLVGLYKTSYAGEDKTTRWLLSTHLQPVFARRIFPCFDEPWFKSVFEISIARRTNMTSLSNMPKKESEPISEEVGWVWDHFEQSRLMPSYLVAFTVFDFKNVQPSFEVDPVFNVWAPEKKLQEANYATEISTKIFTYLQNYFGIDYPLSKIDLVALPELPHRARDNWGIIFFRDSSLLLDSKSESWEMKNNIFKTIVRKLTTQWFGNLVTMNWWTEMWLIDGFATFMEDVVETAVDPVLEDLNSFPFRITQSILDADQLQSVRSLDNEIIELNQIDQLFDDGAINKGSCLIRMLNYTLGEQLFQEGVRHYLKKWAFKSSDENSFWDSFNEVSENKNILPRNLNVKTFINSWIKQEGYPVITINRNYSTGNAIINQTRFVQSESTYDTQWYVPLTFTRKSDRGAVTTLWLEKDKSIRVVNLTSTKEQEWVLFNINQAGFYRVNYDAQNWKLLQQQLIKDHFKILPANRGQLLNDAFELAYANLLDYKTAFELSKYLKMERNYWPWHSLYNSLHSIESILADTPYNGIFQDYIINLIQPAFNEMISEATEEKQEQFLKTFMLQISCRMKYQPSVDWAVQLYKRWMSSLNPDMDNLIQFDLRKTVLCTAIAAGGQREWDFLWAQTRNPLWSFADKKIAYAGLGCTKEPWLITMYLERSLNGSIGIQYIPEVWKSITHPVGLKTGFAYLRSNWERIYSSYHDNHPIIATIFEDFLSKLSTSIDLEDLTSFYKTHKDNLYPVSIQMLNVVARIKSRVQWSKTHLETISTWLLSN